MDNRPRRPVPPPVPASALPQYVAPSRASRVLQLSSFALATGITVYAVLIYDWGTKDHCFMPVRRWVDSVSGDFFTLSEQDRRTLKNAGGAGAVAEPPLVSPSTKTPIEYWKEEREKK